MGTWEPLLSSKFPFQKREGEDRPGQHDGNSDTEAGCEVGPAGRFGAASRWRLELQLAARAIGGHTLFVGVDAGENYSVTANAVGATGPSDYSDAKTLMTIQD